jgi:hypothetical protein
MTAAKNTKIQESFTFAKFFDKKVCDFAAQSSHTYVPCPPWVIETKRMPFIFVMLHKMA